MPCVEILKPTESEAALLGASDDVGAFAGQGPIHCSLKRWHLGFNQSAAAAGDADGIRRLADRSHVERPTEGVETGDRVAVLELPYLIRAEPPRANRDFVGIDPRL